MRDESASLLSSRRERASGVNCPPRETAQIDLSSESRRRARMEMIFGAFSGALSAMCAQEEFGLRPEDRLLSLGDWVCYTFGLDDLDKGIFVKSVRQLLPDSLSGLDSSQSEDT